MCKHCGNIYNGKLLGNKKEWTNDTCNNVGKLKVLSSYCQSISKKNFWARMWMVSWKLEQHGNNTILWTAGGQLWRQELTLVHRHMNLYTDRHLGSVAGGETANNGLTEAQVQFSDMWWPCCTQSLDRSTVSNTDFFNAFTLQSQRQWFPNCGIMKPLGHFLKTLILAGTAAQ